MQMMGHWAGMALKPVDGHVRTRHQLIHKILDRLPLPTWVNSYHDWSLSACPQHFEVMAEAEEDGLIEAIRHEQLPWEGWMWHPEREVVFSMVDIMRIKRLFGE
jgi:putative glutamine amidotransferase